MRTGLLAGAAAGLALLATSAARAETIYVTDPDTVVAPGYVYSPEPNYVVSGRSYVVAEPPAIVVAPPRERVVAVPRREREVVVSRREREVVMPRRERDVVIERPARQVVIEQPAYAAPRDSFGYRGTYVTTGSSNGSCMIDVNGFERCY